MGNKGGLSGAVLTHLTTILTVIHVARLRLLITQLTRPTARPMFCRNEIPFAFPGNSRLHNLDSTIEEDGNK